MSDFGAMIYNILDKKYYFNNILAKMLVTNFR